MKIWGLAPVEPTAPVVPPRLVLPAEPLEPPPPRRAQDRGSRKTIGLENEAEWNLLVLAYLDISVSILQFFFRRSFFQGQFRWYLSMISIDNHYIRYIYISFNMINVDDPMIITVKAVKGFNVFFSNCNWYRKISIDPWFSNWALDHLPSFQQHLWKLLGTRGVLHLGHLDRQLHGHLLGHLHDLVLAVLSPSISEYALYILYILFIYNHIVKISELFCYYCILFDMFDICRN